MAARLFSVVFTRASAGAAGRNRSGASRSGYSGCRCGNARRGTGGRGGTGRDKSRPYFALPGSCCHAALYFYVQK